MDNNFIETKTGKKSEVDEKFEEERKGSYEMWSRQRRI